MDKELEQILRLYEEDESGGRQESTSPTGPEDLADLRWVKSILDARPREAAPEDVVQGVLGLAAGDRLPKERRGDRRPISRSSKRGRPLFTAAGSTLVLLILAGVFIFGLPATNEQNRPEDAPHTSEGTEVPHTSEDSQVQHQDQEPQAALPRRQHLADNQPLQQPLAEKPERSAPAPQQNLAVAETEIVQVADPVEAGLSWDDAQDVRRLHMMIDVVQGRAEEFEWDEPAVPLELLPDSRSPSRSGIQQASQPLPPR